jgi:hypothetical protein
MSFIRQLSDEDKASWAEWAVLLERLRQASLAQCKWDASANE